MSKKQSWVEVFEERFNQIDCGDDICDIKEWNSDIKDFISKEKAKSRKEALGEVRRAIESVKFTDMSKPIGDVLSDKKSRREQIMQDVWQMVKPKLLKTLSNMEGGEE